MRKFSDVITEATGTIVFTFGRFNPPTTGHEKLIKKVASVAGSSPFRIYPSLSNNPKKDPLPFALKVAYMRKMFPRYAKNIKADKNARTAIEIAVKLYKEGFHAINMVVGSDRVKEFQTLLDRYNGVEARHGYYGFDDIRVISAGERDPDAEGVEGMSASKMRAAATSGDFNSFKMGVPSGFKDALKLYNDVRKYMGIREERDMGEMNDFESLRDLYLTGKIWNVGDIVEANGIEGKVIRKGTNYLSYVDEENKVHKAWLHDIVERDYKKEYTNYQGTPEQIARRSSRNKARRVMGDKVVKGLDVGHKDNNPMNNDPSNLRNEDPSVNRREPRLREIKQDKQIKDREGTQPAKYYAKDTEGDAMSKSTKQARARHFDKKKSGPAPGDASATTKPSKHTKKFKQMYGEELPKDADMGDYIDDFQKSDAPQFKGKSKEKRKDMAIAAYLDKKDKNEEVDMDIYHLDEKIEGLVTKAKKSGMPYGILKKVYDRGMAAYKTGHRPGTTAQQWAFARVNSFVTKSSGTWGKADKDLADKVRASEEVEVQETELGMIPKKKRKGHEVLGPESVQEWFESNQTRASYQLRHGEDWWWKLQEVKEAMLEKTGACCDDCAENLEEQKVGGYNVDNDVVIRKGNKYHKTVDNLFKNKSDAQKFAKEFDGFVIPQAGGRFIVGLNKVTESTELDERRDPVFKVKNGPYAGKYAVNFTLDRKKKTSVHKTKADAIKFVQGLRKNKDAKIDDGQEPKKTKKKSTFMKGISPDAFQRFMDKQKAAGLLSKEETELKEKGPCWDGFKQVGMKMKGGKKVPNCVPESWTQEDIDENLRKVKGTDNLYEPKKMSKSARVRSMMDYLGKRDKKDAEKRKKDKNTSDYKMRMFNQMENIWGEVTEKDDKSGKELNNPTRGDVKKYKVYVKNDKGNVVKVEFGDPNMEIKRDDPERRKSFRARHNCDNPGPKYKARYWSCKFWSAKSVSDLMKG